MSNVIVVAVIILIVIIICYDKSKFSLDRSETRSYLESLTEQDKAIDADTRSHKRRRHNLVPMSEPDHFEDIGSETYKSGYKSFDYGPMPTMQPMRKFIASMKKI